MRSQRRCSRCCGSPARRLRRQGATRWRSAGHLTGGAALNSSKSCTAGHIEKAPGEDTVEVYLTDHGIKPTNAVWSLIIDVKKPAQRTSQIPIPSRRPSWPTPSRSSTPNGSQPPEWVQAPSRSPRTSNPGRSTSASSPSLQAKPGRCSSATGTAPDVGGHERWTLSASTPPSGADWSMYEGRVARGHRS